MSLTIDLPQSVETQVLDAAKREGVAPRDYVETVLARHFRRQAVTLPAEEAELLQQINRGLPVEVWQRYEVLHDKIDDETISDAEHREFMNITNQIELADAERLRHLIQLAQLRNISLDALMDQLGLRRRNYG